MLAGNGLEAPAAEEVGEEWRSFVAFCIEGLEHSAFWRLPFSREHWSDMLKQGVLYLKGPVSKYETSFPKQCALSEAPFFPIAKAAALSLLHLRCPRFPVAVA